MQTTEFEIIRSRGDVFVSRNDLVAYLMNEVDYTNRNASESGFAPEFIRGLTEALTHLATNVSAIGR